MFERIVNALRKKEGYISIETIIVAGLIIGLGAVSIGNFQTSANGVVDTATTTVSNVQQRYNQLGQ